LLSSNILKLKADGKYLWVFVGGSIQFFNLQTFKLLNKYELPGRDYGIINDADEINKTCYVTTQNGFYKVGKSAQNKKDTKIYLTSLFINGRDTGQIKNLKLPYNFSDVQINLGTPHLSDAQDILIKYRLKQKDSSRWVYSRRRERSFHFASLMPGKYQFEALAIRGQTGLSSSPLIIDFEILPPWWRRWWALCLWGLMASMLIFFSSRWYYLNMLDKRSAEYEKELAIQEERQRISSEMHDDIGAGLSALKLYTRAGAGSDGADNLAVNELVTELSEKVREVIWSLSINDDSLENLLYFVQANCHSMFERTEIILKVTMPDVIPEVKFDGFARRNVYLIVREAMHNIIKHSKASNAHLIFKISHHLDIQINDNGIGIDNDAGTGAGGKYGIKNMQSRAVALGGKMVIKTNNGTHLSIKVPLGQKVPRRRHR
jgi:signal transduction histidine kinase